LSDYLRYLYQCAITYIQKTHMNSQGMGHPANSHETEFIFSYPNGWDGVQEQMRYAAIKAGLIPATGPSQARLSFVTEGEANLAFVASHGIPNLFPEVNDGVVVIVDAGDYMINISSYTRKSDPTSQRLSFEEITQSQCHLAGSVFVSSQARAFIQRLLAQSKFKDRIENIIQSFDRTLKFRFNGVEQAEYIMFGSTKDNDKRCNIKKGLLKLSGTDIATFFDSSIDCIINSVKDQRKFLRKRATHVVFIGELSASEWIHTRISEAFKPLGYSVIRPGYYINKAIADGSIFHYIDRLAGGIGQPKFQEA